MICPFIANSLSYDSVRNGARPHARHGYYRSRACLIAFLPARRTSNYFYSSMRLVIDVCAFGNVCLWTYDVLCPKILWKDPSSLKWGLAGLASIFVLKYRHPFHFSPFLCPWVPVPQAVSLFSLYGYQSHRLSVFSMYGYQSNNISWLYDGNTYFAVQKVCKYECFFIKIVNVGRPVSNIENYSVNCSVY